MLGGIGVYAAAFLFLWYQQGEKGVESLPCGEQVLGLIQEAKGLLRGQRRGGYGYGQAEREIPDFDEPPMDPPRKSQYGTV